MPTAIEPDTSVMDSGLISVGVSPAPRPPEAEVLLGRSTPELQALCERFGAAAFHGRQLAAWIYRRRARGFDAMSDLSLRFRDTLAAECRIGRAGIARLQTSHDGTKKLLLELADGARVETVLLPYEDRVSVCISSQVGCPVGCVFCATATMGFGRNLTAGEMVDQVLSAADEAGGRPISHVVVMGMGEPLLNYENLVRACRLLRDEVGISYRRQTVSTAGHVPGILRLAKEGLPVTLALSLHAADDELRRRLIPMGKKWPIPELMDALRVYVATTGRRVTLEYLLLGGVNDGEADADRLTGLLRGLVAHVNLIPWNPAASREAFRPPEPEATRRFARVLSAGGTPVTVRVERGQDIDAACGQLAVRERANGEGRED